MVDRRVHRGAHPDDARLFSQQALPALRESVFDLSWLLTRGYAGRSSLALVGDRWRLEKRQRLAVRRCACSEAERRARLSRVVPASVLRGATIWIDGFNLLTTIETALGGGVLLGARDGSLRDMASLHGSYRIVAETGPALSALNDVLEGRGIAACHWLLDAPVSNSGRLAALLREHAQRRGLPWQVEVRRGVDAALERLGEEAIVVSADSRIMERAARIWPLAREVVRTLRPTPWILDLG